MNLNTEDIIKQKLLDTQENVRDFMEYAEDIKDDEVNKIFKEFAEDEAMHGQKLQTLLSKLENYNENVADSKMILIREIQKELKSSPTVTFSNFSKIENGNLDANAVSDIKNYIAAIKKYYSEKYNNTQTELDAWLANYQTTDAKKKEYETLLNTNQNIKTEELVKNMGTDLDPLIKENGQLVATTNPVFRDGSNDNFIRSHFFAPSKNVFGNKINTYWINLFVIWSMSLFMWLTLYFDALKKLLDFFASIPSRIKRK